MTHSYSVRFSDGKWFVNFETLDFSTQWTASVHDTLAEAAAEANRRNAAARGLENIGMALVVWSAMALLWSSRCLSCEGSGMLFPFKVCPYCNGRGWEEVKT